MSIGDVMRQAIDTLDLREGFDRAHALSAWKEVVGPELARICGNPFFAKETLVIPVPGGALRHELNLRRSSIILDINTRVGKKIVAEIRFIAK